MKARVAHSNREHCRRDRSTPSVNLACLTMLLACGHFATAFAQPPIHYIDGSDDLPPGEIGRRQLMRGGPRVGYFQPVEVRVPKKAFVSLAVDGAFVPSEKPVANAGMLLGEVYRLRVSNIPGREDEEVFPSIEVIDRLYPPCGRETRYPIPVEITQEDLEMALEGKFVTRVIYLEDPANPMPERIVSGQPSFEARPNEDALQMADQFGRPMAILRLGTRVPDTDPNTGLFLFGSPTIQPYDPPEGDDIPRDEGLEEPLDEELMPTPIGFRKRSERRTAEDTFWR